MHHTNLHDGWTLRAVSGPVPDAVRDRSVPAVVPGTTHTDLLRAGLIPDPYLGLNETSLAWMHRAGWSYERSLQAQVPGPRERVDLVFDGLDTVATVRLGDAVVGRTFNQHRSFRFDVRRLVERAGGAPLPLTVDFASALEYALGQAERLGARPAAYDYPLGMVRKMACSFGWDWGPDLQTAGIWRPVRLERWEVARLASVRPLVTVGEGARSARVEVVVDVERSGLELADDPLTVTVRLSREGSTAVTASAVVAAGAASCTAVVDVPDPELWWPVGYGEQPLYDLHVELLGRTGESVVLDDWHRRIGLRSVRLDTSRDEVGTAFVIEVNGTPVFVKGANWIPDDHLLTRITRDRLARRVDQALGANLNLLRVWGGGIYESEDFYELCDEAGLMVWQDFPLACAAYPEEEPFRSEFEAEAREHVARLTPHPSLVLWNGGNENLWGFVDWGWQEQLQGRTWGLHYYTELFPAVVAELDPTRPYSDGSPYSPGSDGAVHPNDPDHGTHHEWEVWNRVDYTAYRHDIPRFCSEFGFQAPPAWHTVTRAITPAGRAEPAKDDAVWLLHQKAEDGNDKLDRGLAPHLGVPRDFTDWHWATQLNQARAVSYALTHYRSWWPRTAGAIVWQLNDCWPVTSWSAIDGDELVKPLWWALRASFADRILTVQTRPDPETGVPTEVLAAVNDTGRAWTGTVLVRRQTLDGLLLGRVVLPLDVPARSVALLELPYSVRVPDDATGEVLVASWSDPESPDEEKVRTVHYWAEDVDLRLDPDGHDVAVEAVPGGYLVTVSATRSLVKDLCLFVDRLDPSATVDAALVTLPAGTSVQLRVTSEVPGLEAALGQRPVLRTANDLVLSRRQAADGQAASRPALDEALPQPSSVTS